MAYSNKVIDHYENPRNVGSLPKDSANVGTGLVGAPECGDVMKLQIRVDDSGKIEPTALNDTNKIELRVFANEAYRQAVLIARLDNLGKGASGAAVQNLKLMLSV